MSENSYATHQMRYSISEENLRKLNYSSYHDYSDDDNNNFSPVVRLSITQDPMGSDVVLPIYSNYNNEPANNRYFNKISFLNNNIISLNKRCQHVLYLYLHNVINYSILITYSNDLMGVMPILSFSMNILLTFTLFDKVKIVNPSMMLIMVLFKRKKIKKLLTVTIIQIISTVLASTTVYLLYKYNSSADVSKLYSFSNVNYYKLSCYVLVYNCINVFMFLKSIINNEIVYYIVSNFLLTVVFIKYIYNVDNMINDITQRIIWSIINMDVTLLNDIIVPIVSISSIVGTIIGTVIYILLIDSQL